MSVGGYALRGYNEGSFHQRMQLMMVADNFIESLDYVKRLTNGQILIVDYGSSEGYNSQMFLCETLSKFRESSSNTILVIHNDLPQNDWVKTFDIVLNSQESYSKLPGVYFSAIGRSFYNQILPNGSVHIGFSSASFNWLSQPLNAPDSIIPSASNDRQFKSMASEVAYNDLVTLLRLRHKELINSGRLVLQFINETIATSSFSTIIHEASENLCRKGIITQEEKGSITIPIYGRTEEEVHRALNEVAELYKVISFCQLGDVRIPIENLSEEAVNGIRNGLKKLAVSFWKGALNREIKRNDEEKNAICKLFAKEVSEIADQGGIDRWPTYHSFVLEKISS